MARCEIRVHAGAGGTATLATLSPSARVQCPTAGERRAGEEMRAIVPESGMGFRPQIGSWSAGRLHSGLTVGRRGQSTSASTPGPRSRCFRSRSSTPSARSSWHPARLAHHLLPPRTRTQPRQRLPQSLNLAQRPIPPNHTNSVSRSPVATRLPNRRRSTDPLHREHSKRSAARTGSCPTFATAVAGGGLSRWTATARIRPSRVAWCSRPGLPSWQDRQESVGLYMLTVPTGKP